MTNRTLFLARHGETTYGKKIVFIGRTDVDLSENGQEQAAWLGEELKKEKLAAIYTSPLKRCRQTTEFIAKHYDLTPKIVDDLAEIDLGKWEGLEIDEVQKGWPDEFAKRREDMENFAPPGGEAWGAVQKRVVAAIEKILKEAPEGPVFVCAHLGVIGVYLCHVMELPLSVLFNMGQDHGCLNRIDFFDGKGLIKLMNYTGQEDEEEPEENEQGTEVGGQGSE